MYTVFSLAVNLPTSSMQLGLHGIVSDPNDLNLQNIETFSEFVESRDVLSRSLLNAVCNSKCNSAKGQRNNNNIIAVSVSGKTLRDFVVCKK